MGDARYTRTAISLHWLVALLIFTGWTLGVYMHELPSSPEKLRYYSWHKWIGVTVFMLVVLRSTWRLGHPAPELPATLPAWQRTAAHVSHALLYVLMLSIPLSGWLMSSAKGFQTVWFGIVPLPDLLEKNEPLGKLLAQVHKILAFTLAGLVTVHVSAAIRHGLARDGVMQRMLPVLVALVLIAAAAPNAIDPARSRVTAVFRQMNVPVEGAFSDVRGTVRFDPKQPAAGRARVEIGTASFTLGEPEYDDEVRSKEWLDSTTHPRATFLSSKVTPAGPDRFTATGALSLKGRSETVTVTFTARDEPGRRVYEGEFPLSRKAWNIGAGQWDDVLEDAVVVTFRIVTAAPKSTQGTS